MKLLTAAIIKKLKKSHLGSHDGQKVTPVIVKFFTPDSSWSWYATEALPTPRRERQIALRLPKPVKAFRVVLAESVSR
jgi:hypothetical protein